MGTAKRPCRTYVAGRAVFAGTLDLRDPVMFQQYAHARAVYTHARTHARTHAHTHTRTITHTQTHTHTDTHTYTH